MDYRETDRLYSSWVLTAKKRTTRFYLTDDRVASDILSNAMVFRYYKDANTTAGIENSDPVWIGFQWKPVLYAQAVSMRSRSAV